MCCCSGKTAFYWAKWSGVLKPFGFTSAPGQLEDSDVEHGELRALCRFRASQDQLRAGRSVVTTLTRSCLSVHTHVVGW